MDTNKMRMLFVLAETKSFSEASAILKKTQPVISRQVAEVEEKLQTALFDRDSKHVEITPAGAFYLEGLRNIEGRLDTLISETRTIQNGYAGQLNFGVLAGQLLTRNYSGLLDAFRNRHPEINITFAAAGFSELERKLRNHELDFVCCAAHGDFISPDYGAFTVGETRTVLLISASHPKAAANPYELSIRDFADDTFITYEEYESRPGFISTEEFFYHIDMKPKIHRVKSYDTMNLLLEAGDGVALLNDNALLCANPNLKILHLSGLVNVMESLIWSKRSSKPCAAVFREFAREYLASAGREQEEPLKGEERHVGIGSRKFRLIVDDGAGFHIAFVVHTEETMVGKALEKALIITAKNEDDQVLTICGTTGDRSREGRRWAFYIDSEPAELSVGQTPIETEKVYSLIFEQKA